MNSKYSTFLTILLVVIIIAIVVIIGFLGYKFISSENSKKQAEDFADSWTEIKKDDKKDETSSTVTDTTIDVTEPEITDSTKTESTATSTSEKKYNNFLVAGTIEIPRTGYKGPIISFSEYSKSSLETAVCVVYSTTGEESTPGSGINKVGNTTIAGHNYRNGNFFSNNKKINVGDKIYITDLDGKRMTYTVYNKYETDDTDADYMTRDTQGAVEISLTTCTDDSKQRLIIWAKADA